MFLTNWNSTYLVLSTSTKHCRILYSYEQDNNDQDSSNDIDERPLKDDEVIYKYCWFQSWQPEKYFRKCKSFEELKNKTPTADLI